MKEKVNVWDYAGQILSSVGKGILITTKAEDKVNTMTIGWGTLGVEWGQPIFTAFVRKSRFTDELLRKNPEFTVNIPLGEVKKELVSFCGSKSGRDLDKITELGLHLEESDTLSVPGIRELPLTLECKVIYTQQQELSALDSQCRDKFYAEGSANEKDLHTAYYGKITGAYIIR